MSTPEQCNINEPLRNLQRLNIFHKTIKLFDILLSVRFDQKPKFRLKIDKQKLQYNQIQKKEFKSHSAGDIDVGSDDFLSAHLI